jgi:LPXTG-motif cell wall-anchored protein
MIKIKSLLAVTLSVTSLFFTIPNYGSVYAISETDETITVSDESQDVYFNISGDYVSVDLGECTAVELEGYDNSVLYEEGESTVEFSIEDESIAIVKSVQGNLVNVYGISEGETVLNAVTPDGRTASVRIVVKYSNLVFFVTSTTTSDDADFSETNVTTVTTTSPYSAATDENGHYVTDENGRILDNSGNVLIINGTSAVMTQSTTISTTTTTTTTDVTTTETTATSDEESTVTTTESEITSTSTTIETTSSSSDTTTGTNSTTTTTTTEGTTLPQTGYSDIYKVVIILAVLMTVSGVVIVVKTKKETE